MSSSSLRSSGSWPAVRRGMTTISYSRPFAWWMVVSRIPSAFPGLGGLRLHVPAQLLVDVQVGHEIGERAGRVLALPVGDEAHEPGDREDRPLRRGRAHGEQVVDRPGRRDVRLQ